MLGDVTMDVTPLLMLGVFVAIYTFYAIVSRG